MTEATVVRRVSARVLGVSVVARAVRAIARARGFGLVLVFHRLGQPAPTQIVPTVGVETFRRQLEALRDVADIVDLPELVAGPEAGGRSIRDGGGRPAVALTFDDDLPSHAAEALPALRAVGARGTFFLSGRALVGAGAYWFQRLEALVDVFGCARVARELGAPARSPIDLAHAAERDHVVRGRIDGLARDVDDPPVLGSADLRELGDSGMSIGFHTVEHVPLPSLDDRGLAGALTDGRAELRDLIGRELDRFAYPHGAVDARSRSAVAAAGFTTAWTGSPTAVRRSDDPLLLGRWEPGPLPVDEFLVKLAVRLHRRPSGRGRGR